MVRLNIGCGRSRLNGWINCDLHPGPNVDRVFDAQKKPWPFPDRSVTEIYASHVLEHLVDTDAFFEEAWRVLQPLGGMFLRMPYGNSRGAWWDLTHVRPWFPESFCGLQPNYDAAVGNRQYDAKERAFWVLESLIFVSGGWARLYRVPGCKRLVHWAVKHLNDVGQEMWVMLQRTTHGSHWESRHPNAVPVQLAVTGKALGIAPKNGLTEIYRLPNPKPVKYTMAKSTWGEIIEETHYYGQVPLDCINPFDDFHKSDGNGSFVCTSDADTEKHRQSVQYVRELIRAGKRIRPILVQKDLYGRYQRMDGFSRYWAHAMENTERIWVIIVPNPKPGGQQGQSMELDEGEWNLIQSSNLPIVESSMMSLRV